MSSEPSERVECARHGTTPITFACRHVAAGIACGFHHSTTDINAEPMGWCDLCDENLAVAGEWSDALLHDMKVICTQCWDNARTLNAAVPPLARGTLATLDSAERAQFLAAARAHLATIQDRAKGRWNLAGAGVAGERWDYSEVRRTITFSGAGGAHATASVRMIGSYATSSKSFQWAPALFDPHDPVVAGIAELRAFGEVRGITELTRSWWECGLASAWDMAAIASYIVGGEAVYRAPMEDVYWFMLLDDIRAA